MEKAISITYSEVLLVSLGIQHAMRIHHVVMCGLPDFGRENWKKKTNGKAKA
jgi:hypothetical protein